MQSNISFVVRVGRHLKLKNVLRNGQKYTKKCKICSIYFFSARCHGNTYWINEEFVLVFTRGDIWLFIGIVFSSEFKNLFIYLFIFFFFFFFCGKI